MLPPWLHGVIDLRFSLSPPPRFFVVPFAAHLYIYTALQKALCNSLAIHPRLDFLRKLSLIHSLCYVSPSSAASPLSAPTHTTLPRHDEMQADRMEVDAGGTLTLLSLRYGV